jgi:hypothetical protein
MAAAGRMPPIVRRLARPRYHDAMDLAGLSVLVTGANGNVGSTVAGRLAREGCRENRHSGGGRRERGLTETVLSDRFTCREGASTGRGSPRGRAVTRKLVRATRLHRARRLAQRYEIKGHRQSQIE